MELGPKGAAVRVETLTIPPLHPMRELRGPAEELRALEAAGANRGEYLRLVVTDQPLTPELADFFQRLAEERGSVLMERLSEFRRFTGEAVTPDERAVQEQPLEELFAAFFAQRSGSELPEEDRALLHRAGELLADGDDVRAQALADFLLGQEVAE